VVFQRIEAVAPGRFIIGGQDKTMDEAGAGFD